MKHWLDSVLVEYYFLFRHQAVRERLQGLRQTPGVLHIEGTNVCNAKCVFCAYPKMKRLKQTMQMEDFRRIVDEYISMGGQHVSLTPIVGDPLVDRYFFERLNDLAERPQVKNVSFYTNAILMSSEISQRLMPFGEKVTVNISWGGFDRQTYRTIMGVDRFQAVCENVEAFIEIKRRTESSVRLVIALRGPSSNCVGSVWDRLRVFENENLLSFTRIEDYDSWAGKISNGDLLDIELKPRRMPHKRGACELLVNTPVVLANGQVNGCACRDVEAELIVGDLKESSLAEISRGKNIAQLIERQERGDYPDVCKRCTYYVSVYNRRKSFLHKKSNGVAT